MHQPDQPFFLNAISVGQRERCELLLYHHLSSSSRRSHARSLLLLHGCSQTGDEITAAAGKQVAHAFEIGRKLLGGNESDSSSAGLKSGLVC